MEKISDRKAIKCFNLFLALTAALAVMLTVSFDSEAASQVDTEAQGALSLEYAYNDQPIVGAEYRIYRVADMTPYGRYILSGDFKDLPVNLEGLDSTGWKEAADTLAVYVSAYQMEPLKEGRTDTVGQADAGILPTGMYLIIMNDIRIEDIIYQSSPFLVSIPSLGEDDSWIYEVTARPKTVSAAPSGNEEMTVIKVWNDSGLRQYRPQEIEVTLLKDGVYYDKVTLSASNYWRHTWSGLSSESIWSAVEGSVSDSYTVTYTNEGIVYTITNTATGHRSGGGDGSGGGGRKPTPPVYENIPDTDVPEGNLDIPEEPVPLSGLPQTGLLWWPVPFLIITGLLLVGLGYKDIFGRKSKKDEK